MTLVWKPAIVFGVAAVAVGIGGTAAGKATALLLPCWILVGDGLGWLVVAIWRIIKGSDASVDVNDDPGVTAALTMPIWPDGVIAIGIIVGLLATYGVYAIAKWPM